MYRKRKYNNLYFEATEPIFRHRHIGIAIYYHSLAIIECLRDKNFEPEVREKYKAQLDAHKENFSILASYSNVNYGLNYKILVKEICDIIFTQSLLTSLYICSVLSYPH